ncbi:MAG: DUF1704 domain-containing protein [Patescibacteria group bacterium]|jgi:alpha-L-glutamate ligase-like protein/uncharacterized protein (TIGR02421 family)|nr:DUF1704 domain-containing protein [Patescibacteria group bacterium]
MSWLDKRQQILGVNARNLLYINRYNSELNKNFADDKIKTKNYLQSRGIGAARLYAVIRSYKELRNFNPDILPGSFAIKPNHGFGGEGIILIKERRGDKFIAGGNKKYDWDDLYQECAGIIDGRYAVSGLRDQVIFEELLVGHDYFFDFIEKGLPDIRVIVFNLVPVMAMLRLPTPESGGRANLHSGAIGLGIDIGSGSTTYGVLHGRLIKNLPNGKPVNSLNIPMWEDVLLTASQVQQLSQVGFLGVDLVISKTGIKVLEINARAGLEIQVANFAPLKTRLNKVIDLEISNPQEGVTVAKTLFSKTKLTERPNAEKPIISLYEQIEIFNANLNPLLAKIDPHATRNVLDQSLAERIDSENLVSLKLAGKRINIPFEFVDLTKHRYKAILAGKFLGDFLVDISAKSYNQRKIDHPSPSGISKEEKIIKNIDRRIYQIDRQLGIIPRFKPINLLEEKELFFQNSNYNPKFIYKKLTVDLDEIRKEIKKIPHQVDHPLILIYQDKIKELNRKVALLEARGTEKIQYYSEKLYGSVSKAMYQSAVNYLNQHPVIEDSSDVFNTKKIQRTLNDYLAEKKLNHWKVKLSSETAADISVGRRNHIILKTGVKMSANRLAVLIAHEIETHIFRLENARLQAYRIFEVGTNRYITTEEGLAIYNQARSGLALGSKSLWAALNVVAVYLGRNKSFAELFHYLVTNYNLEKDEAFKICVKVKRGLSDTEKNSVFSRDFIYFAGYQAINNLINQAGLVAIKRLYFGKIGIDDLPTVAQLKNRKIKYLPDYLK